VKPQNSHPLVVSHSPRPLPQGVPCQNFVVYEHYIYVQVEINKILELGVDPSRIIFANPAKPASHIRHAAALGVDTMTFDNETELHKIKSLYPAAKYV